MKFTLNTTLILAVASIMAACATPKSQELVQAQQEYTQAKYDQTVTNNAPVALHEAEQALNKAQNAEDIEAQKHYAYIAQKKVELAKVIADNDQTRQKAAQLEEQQQQFLLQVRQQRALQAQQQAQQAQRELRAYRSQQQQQELQELRDELAAKSEQTKQGIVLTLTDVVFAFDKAELKSGAERGLGKLSDLLKSHPDRRILVEGFTDSIGSSAYNQELSQRRAESVARALEEDGISRARITARGLGERYPVAPNSTAAGRQQNRRVEITILNPEYNPMNAGRGGQT